MEKSIKDALLPFKDNSESNKEQLKQVSEEQLQDKSDKMYSQFLEREIVANKQLRKDLDEKIQVLSNLDKSRERSLAITKLEEAVMWLGMDLKRLGAQNPYPSSKDPSTGVLVELTADGLKFSS